MYDHKSHRRPFHQGQGVQLVTTKPIVKIKKSKEFATTSVNNTPEIWYSTTTITLEDEYLDLTISLRQDIESGRTHLTSPDGWSGAHD